MSLRNITTRTCCWTIPIRLGAFFLGIVGLLLCVLELAVLLPYDFGFDIETFNPIDKYLKNASRIDSKNFDDLMEKFKNDYLDKTCIALTIDAGLFGIACLCLILGLCIFNRILMLLYLIYQMLRILAFLGTGFLIAIYIHIDQKDLITTIGSGAVILIILVLTFIPSIYFWSVVLRAFKDIGEMKNLQKLTDLNEDFSYSRGQRIINLSPQNHQVEEDDSDFEPATPQTPDTLSANDVLHYDSGIYENLPNSSDASSLPTAPPTPTSLIDTYNPLDPHGDNFTGPYTSFNE